MPSMETGMWGDVPTWIGAITTLGALVAAGAVVAIELRRDKRDATAAARAEQADRVAVWNDVERSEIHLRNGSDLPIFNVEVVVVSEAKNDATLERRQAPPGDTFLDYPRDVLGAFEDMSLMVRFTDAAGRSWSRFFDGTLTRLPDAYARTHRVPTESRTHTATGDEGG